MWLKDCRCKSLREKLIIGQFWVETYSWFKTTLKSCVALVCHNISGKQVGIYKEVGVAKEVGVSDIARPPAARVVPTENLVDQSVNSGNIHTFGGYFTLVSCVPNSINFQLSLRSESEKWVWEVSEKRTWKSSLKIESEYWVWKSSWTPLPPTHTNTLKSINPHSLAYWH